MRLLGVDVDDTIVTMDWEAWKAKQEVGYDPLDYWRSDTLYDNLQPMEGVVEKLGQLSKYFRIIFVSRLKGNHHRSKVYFLKKYFPFMEGFVGTHEKWILNDSLVAMIDDLPDNLTKFAPHKRILFGGEELKNWNEFSIRDFYEKYL